MKFNLQLCTIILSVFCFLGCNSKQPQDSEFFHESGNVEEESNDLEFFVKNRFEENPFLEKSVTFSDGYVINLSDSLDFSGIKDKSATFYLGDYLVPSDQFQTDANGVILVNNQYHITEIGKRALIAAQAYKKSGSENAKTVFLDQMKWIEENFYQTDTYGFWYFQQDSPLYNLQPAWTSVLSQGWMMNACLEAYHITENKKYLNLVEKAIKAYLIPVENGGFMRPWNEDEIWFEEYGTSRPSRVLNGAIFGLEGVYNLYLDSDIELVKKIFDEGVKTVKNHLQDYDAVWTSRYNLADWKNEVAFEHYHEIHIIQLLWLYKVTGEEKFKEYAHKFLANDRHNFFKGNRYELDPKILQITASHTIDSKNNGTDNLLNDTWAFGNYWSSHLKTELVIDFGKHRKNFKGVTLFHVNDRSKDVDFDLYALAEDTKEWRLVQRFSPKYIKDKISIYNETDKYETFVEHFKITENADARKLKIVFNANPTNIIAIRNINFIFDRSDEINHLVEIVNAHINTLNKTR